MNIFKIPLLAMLTIVFSHNFILPITEAEAFKTLGLQQGASEEAIRAAYKKLALKWHPDKWVAESPDDKKKAEEMFKIIGDAHTLLINKNNSRKQQEEETQRRQEADRAYREQMQKKRTEERERISKEYAERAAAVDWINQHK